MMRYRLMLKEFARVFGVWLALAIFACMVFLAFAWAMEPLL